MRFLAPIFGLGAFVLSILTPVPAQAQFYQCVAYAREATGVEIRGNANTWWGQAEGRFQRGKTPKAGAILAFKSMPGMRAGHVAVVAQVVSDREILIDHANWSHPGRVEHGVRAVDVSPEGDWSEVRVWYAGAGDLGTRTNRTFGFIYPGTHVTPADARSVDAGPADAGRVNAGVIIADAAIAKAHPALLSPQAVQFAMLGS